VRRGVAREGEVRQRPERNAHCDATAPDVLQWRIAQVARVKAMTATDVGMVTGETLLAKALTIATGFYFSASHSFV
jgi:hypothetical protein